MNDRRWHPDPIINAIAQAAANGQLESQLIASADTRPEGGDALAAPFTSGAVPSEASADAQQVSDHD